MSNSPEVQGRLVPKLFSVLREGYRFKQFHQDLLAGAIVGVVALPLAIAFAIASGVEPSRGLYTAVVAGFIISALGGSRVQIGGPTGAFIVIVYGIVQEHGYSGLALATMMAGVLMVIMGVARLGAIIKFVPYPVTIGFTSGIALYIASSQMRDFLGLEMSSVPAEFLEKLHAYYGQLGSWNPAAFGIGLATIAIVVYWPRLTHKVPGSIIAIVVTTALVQVLNLDVETIGKRFSTIPSTLPMPALPDIEINLENLRKLSSPAIAIALLGAIESLLSAVVADGMTGFRHRSNMELVAQGIANIASPLFGGLPATGAIARTATNVKNGARTPIAGMIHALTLLIIMLFLGRWAALIPLSTLAGILLVVAYHMSEWRHFLHLFRSPRHDIAVLLVTFFLTVLVDLTVAIQVGMVLAAFLFMHRMANVTQAGFVTKMLRDNGEGGNPRPISERDVPAGVEVFEIYGSFFFGAASKFRDALSRVEGPPKVLILRMREVSVIDATGLRALEELLGKAAADGTKVLMSGLQPQPRRVFERSGLIERIGEENICADIDCALSRSREILGAVPVPAPAAGG